MTKNTKSQKNVINHYNHRSGSSYNHFMVKLIIFLLVTIPGINTHPVCQHLTWLELNHFSHITHKSFTYYASKSWILAMVLGPCKTCFTCVHKSFTCSDIKSWNWTMVPGPFNNLQVLYSLRLDTLEKYGIIIRMEMIGLSPLKKWITL